MNTAPAHLLETLAGLDATLGETVHDALGADTISALPDAELLELTRLTEALGRRVDTLRITTAAEVDHRSRTELGEERLSARSGCSSAADLLCRVTGVAGTTARARIRQGRAVAVRTTLTGEPLPALFPTVREALVDGGIGIDSVTAITAVLGSIADRTNPAQWSAAEYELTAAATGHGADGAPPCTADETRIQAKVWELVLDPDGALPDAERAARKRGIRFGPDQGGIRPVNGWILTELYEQFRLLADAHLNPRVADLPDPTSETGDTSDTTGNGVTAPTGRTGDGINGPGVTFRENPDTTDETGPAEPKDTRSYAQKLHDVFASILGIAARSAEAPTLGGAAPVIVITIDDDDLHPDRHDSNGAGDHDGRGTARGDAEGHEGIGFINGTDCTVPAFVARQNACNAGTQRQILDGDGRIIALGTPNRTFNAAQRKAITARDGTCIIPGCHAPAAWCEIHHVTPHAEGGPTHVDNGVPLCWWHHRTIETSGWQIRMVNGLPQVRAPRNLDPTGAWRPAHGSLHHARNRLRRRLGNTTRTPATDEIRRT